MDHVVFLWTATMRFSQITKMLQQSSTICVKAPEMERKKKCVAQQVNFIQKVYSETTLIVVPPTAKIN